MRIASERSDIRPGLRNIRFECPLTIAFVDADATVTVLRVFAV